jgi:hypothetical protein
MQGNENSTGQINTSKLYHQIANVQELKEQPKNHSTTISSTNNQALCPAPG